MIISNTSRSSIASCGVVLRSLPVVKASCRSKAVGQEFDATGLLGGKRSKRYAFVVEGGVVRKAFVEDNAPDVTVTSAENVLKAI